MYELQKASLLKRASAYLLDIILVAVLAVGFGWIFSSILGYDSYHEEWMAAQDEYERNFGIIIEVAPEDFDALTNEKKSEYENALGITLPATKEEYEARYIAADEAMGKDQELIKTYSMMLNISLITSSFGVLLAFLVLEFGVPMLLKNGQTVGKKIFQIGVMQITGIRIFPFSLFVRAILGKYSIGTMIPLLCCILFFFGAGGGFPVILVFGIILLQAALIIVTREHKSIHDLIASTVVVDMQTQMIFKDKEALLAHQKKLAAEKAEDARY